MLCLYSELTKPLKYVMYLINKDIILNYISIRSLKISV